MAKYFVARRRSPKVRDKSDMEHGTAKHKLSHGSGDVDWYAHTKIYKSVRSVNLQHILHINHLLQGRSAWLHRRLADRYKDYYKDYRTEIGRAGFRINNVGQEVDRLHPCHLVMFLGYGDIMDAVGCSRRTAAEYRTVLAEIHGYYEIE